MDTHLTPFDDRVAADVRKAACRAVGYPWTRTSTVILVGPAAPGLKKPAELNALLWRTNGAGDVVGVFHERPLVDRPLPPLATLDFTRLRMVSLMRPLTRPRLVTVAHAGLVLLVCRVRHHRDRHTPTVYVVTDHEGVVRKATQFYSMLRGDWPSQRAENRDRLGVRASVGEIVYEVCRPHLDDATPHGIVADWLDERECRFHAGLSLYLRKELKRRSSLGLPEQTLGESAVDVLTFREFLRG